MLSTALNVIGRGFGPALAAYNLLTDVVASSVVTPNAVVPFSEPIFKKGWEEFVHKNLNAQRYQVCLATKETFDSYGTFAKGIIEIGPKIVEADPEAALFLAKYQFHLMQGSGRLLPNLISFVVCTVFSMSHWVSWYQVGAANLSFHIISHIMLIKFGRLEAIYKAFSDGSHAEKLGAIRYSIASGDNRIAFVLKAMPERVERFKKNNGLSDPRFINLQKLFG